MTAPKPLPSAAPSTRESVQRELAAETARRFGALKIKVTGDSMLPALRPGDVLTVVRQPIGGFRPGDIVLGARPSPDAPGAPEFVAHRVVRKPELTGVPRLITRGDSLPQNDSPLLEHEILGRVTAVTRRGRRIDPRLTLRRRLAACVLRRSAFSSRMLLRLNRFRSDL